MPWSRAFDDPIPHPDGGTIRTLEEAGHYILAGLSKKEAAKAHWQLAMEQLIEAAEERGFVMFARIGFMKALNFGKQVTPRQKRAKTYRIIP